MNEVLYSISNTNKILRMGFWITQLYPITAAILFVYLTRMASMMLEKLVHELPETHIISYRPVLILEVAKWKRNYHLIHDFIEEISGFFGFILLVFFGYQLAKFTTFLFWLDHELKYQRVLWYQYQLIIYSVRVIIYVWLLPLTTHQITKKVSNITF